MELSNPNTLACPSVRPYVHMSISYPCVGVNIGVFHGVAGVARATPGLIELPSAGKGIEVSR